MSWLHQSPGISRATAAKWEQTREVQPSWADSHAEVCLQIMTAGSEVREIRGWEKQPRGDVARRDVRVLREKQAPGAGTGQVPLGRTWRRGRGMSPQDLGAVGWLARLVWAVGANTAPAKAPGCTRAFCPCPTSLPLLPEPAPEPRGPGGSQKQNEDN